MFQKLSKLSWLFVSERKQIALMADEKPTVRISHRLFATSRSEMRIRVKIEHTAMYVNDLEKAREFFVTYFEARSNNGYHNEKTGLKTYFLTFEDGPRLELMTRPGMSDKKKELMGTGYVHLAFSTGSREKVDLLTKRLKEDGYEVLSGPRNTGDGYYESCVLGIEGNQIEITV